MKNAVKLIAVLLALAALIAGCIMVSGYIKSNRYFVLTDEQVKTVLAANVYEDENARTIAESAASLVGKVHYFWGGKSAAKGWDDRWGELTLVESEGSETSGTMRPFGLDCSGYITWIYMQTDIEKVRGMIGDGTYYQWEKSAPIDWKDIKVGDLVFQNKYPGAKSNHVAVCIGFYEGRPVFAHCSSAHNNVVVTTADGIFKYARRPNITLSGSNENAA